MNRNAIRKTSVCYWSIEDKCFVVESPLFDSIAGVGETPEESMSVFEDLLYDAYEAELAGRMHKERPGRPSKGGTALNCDVHADTKQYIKQLAQDFHCSQGEAIDFLAFFHQKTSNIESNIHERSYAPAESNRLNLLSKKLEEALRLIAEIRARTGEPPSKERRKGTKGRRASIRRRS